MEEIATCFPEDFKITKFECNALMSTYLFAIVSGPFDVDERFAEIPGKSESIRMRFM